MFEGDTDFPTSVMIMMGIDPAKSTEEDWKRAAEEMKKLKPQIRELVDNSGMADGLSSGNAWVSQAYSGDIYQLNIGGSPDIKFVVPKEGATYWTDNMAIPKNAKHPLDAITYMDYVYRPEVAAQLIEAIAYVTPVPAAREQLQAKAAKASGEDRQTLEGLVQSPLIFPTEADFANTKRYRALTVEEEQVWDGIFQPLVQS
jgi:spermidine/putrescine transport system substrate-binding protein